MQLKQIEKLILRMKSEGKDETRLKNAYESYKSSREKIHDTEDIKKSMIYLNDYGRAFSDILILLQELVDANYISRDDYLTILKEL